MVPVVQTDLAVDREVAAATPVQAGAEGMGLEMAVAVEAVATAAGMVTVKAADETVAE